MWLIVLGVISIILGIIYITHCAKTSEKIAGGVCTLAGIMIIVFGSILEGASWREILTYLFVAGIIASSGFAFFFFKHKEKTKGVISLVVLALILVCFGLNSPSPDQTCWECGRKFVSYEDSNGFCKSCNEYHKNIVNHLP